jgi:hypothetical protein
VIINGFTCTNGVGAVEIDDDGIEEGNDGCEGKGACSYEGEFVGFGAEV